MLPGSRGVLAERNEQGLGGCGPNSKWQSYAPGEAGLPYPGPPPTPEGLHSATNSCGRGVGAQGVFRPSTLSPAQDWSEGPSQPLSSWEFPKASTYEPSSSLLLLQAVIPGTLLVTESPCFGGTPPASWMLVPLPPLPCYLFAPCHLSAPAPLPPGTPLGLPLFSPAVRVLPALASLGLRCALLGTWSQFVMRVFMGQLLESCIHSPRGTGSVSGFVHCISSQPSHAWIYMFDQQVFLVVTGVKALFQVVFPALWRPNLNYSMRPNPPFCEDPSSKVGFKGRGLPFTLDQSGVFPPGIQVSWVWPPHPHDAQPWASSQHR